jgi:hypothetical protein
MARITSTLVLLALVTLALLILAAPSEAHDLTCVYPGAGSFDVTCQLTDVHRYALDCGGITYFYASPLDCSPSWTFDPAVMSLTWCV